MEKELGLYEIHLALSLEKYGLTQIYMNKWKAFMNANALFLVL